MVDRLAAVAERFESAEVILEAAQNALYAIKREEAAYFADKPFEQEVLPSADDRFEHLGIRVTKKVPRKIRVLAYQIINDLRNVLDQSLAAGVKTELGKRPRSGVHFPFAETPVDYDKLWGHHRYASIPARYRDAIRQFEPWPTSDAHSGGNNYLKWLNMIAQPNKHEVAVRMQPDWNAITVHRATVVGFAKYGNFDVPRIKEGRATVLTFQKGRSGDYGITLPVGLVLDEGKLPGFGLFSTMACMHATVAAVHGELFRQARLSIA